jgi:putative transposase
MARRQRNSLPGATYHIMLRGNNGQHIFTNDEERCKLCLLLQEGVERYGHRILAFCFMSNHIHLAIQLGNVSISKIVQNLAFRYTRFYNWRHKTIGHLFQGRFKSVLVDSGRYLRELVRYIHLNPVSAKLVDNPGDYRWSSHRAYLMLEEYSWLSMEALLLHFGESRSQAITALNDFVHEGIGIEEGFNFEAGFSDGILGEDEFIKKITIQSEEINNLQSVIDFETLILHIVKKYDVDINSLKKPGMDRKSSHIRAITALIARDTKGVTLEDLAKFFDREASGISKAAARLDSRMRTSDVLKNEVRDLINQCTYKQSFPQVS